MAKLGLEDLGPATPSLYLRATLQPQPLCPSLATRGTLLGGTRRARDLAPQGSPRSASRRGLADPPPRGLPHPALSLPCAPLNLTTTHRGATVAECASTPLCGCGDTNAVIVDRAAWHTGTDTSPIRPLEGAA